MMKLQHFFKLFFIFFFTYSAHSSESMDNRVKKLTLELRCMTCQNQSVYDSDSDYSEDIKILVKEKFEEGLKSMRSLLVNRYDYVRSYAINRNVSASNMLS